MKKKFYITTSIAYTNAPPHIGYALELIQADVIARYHRLLGKDVFFLTGTDEHGLKIARAAEKAGKSPEQFTDEISAKFGELTKALNLSNNDFIRTSDKKRHWPKVQKVWLKLLDRGDIEKRQYKGWYCVGCEAFVKEKDLVGDKCPIHQTKPELIEEENWFFKLSKYAPDVKKEIENDKINIVPEARKNEILSFINQGVEDISVSRLKENLKWGIPVPGDDNQIIYVWFEALLNYLLPEKYWPADVHCVGKDIFRFHALMWPAMLLALGLERPKNILVHGFITSGGQKMSKSLGNVVDPFELVKKYGTDAVRYFLLREIPATEDGDFTFEKFEGRYNSDLASGLGNLVARVIKLAEISGVEKAISEKNLIDEYKKTLKAAKEKHTELLEKFEFSIALTAVWILIKFCDQQIEKEKLWEKSGKQKEIIGNLLFIVGEIAKSLKPFLPETSEKILQQLNTKENKPLFPRI